ncbi:MAG TPA: SelB C-terminal domain-containing protein, partial [Gemmata sp.]
ATGIDLALLVVAADDSIMPQTREHLEILKLLRVRRGLIALTKADLVDETTREVAGLEVRELVRGSFLDGAPIVHTSAHTGLGVAELRAALASVASTIPERDGNEWFRLPIDRAFVVQGHGTVVTGSVVTGSVAAGDELEWHKGDGTSELVRARGLNNHGHPADEVHRGQRAAVNLAGVPHELVHRGQELARPGYLVATKVLTVRLLASGDGKHGIKHRLPLRLHIGTAEVMATVSLLDCDAIGPGQWGLAQLFLVDPVSAVWGQPFVVRDSSAEHTLGGGQVLQPNATKVRRRHIEAIEHIEKLWSDDAETRARAVAWFAGFHGFASGDLVRSAGAAPDHVDSLVASLTTAGAVAELVLASNRRALIHADRIAELEARVLDTLAAMHSENPLMTNHDRQKVLAKLAYIGAEPLLQTITDHLMRAKKVVGDARRIARADFKPKLSANQRKLKDKIVEAHVAAPFTPPEPKEFVNQAGGNASALNDIFEVACAEGFLVRITAEFYLSAEAEAEMRRRVSERLVGGSGATVAEIRDLLGTTRKYAVPVCEYLDRIGLTKRTGDVRVLTRPGVPT